MMRQGLQFQIEQIRFATDIIFQFVSPISLCDFGLQVMKYVEYDNMHYPDCFAMQNGSTTILSPYAGACYTYNYIKKYWPSMTFLDLN